MANKLKKAFDTPSIFLFSRGLGIPIHAHIIIYPSTGEGPMETLLAGFRAAEPLFRISPSELDEIAEKIRGAG